MNLQRPRPLAIGDRLHGFCQGYFGRDSYNCKIVEARGVDWVVFRNTSGGIELAAGTDLDVLANLRDNPDADHTEGCPLHVEEEGTW